MQDVGENVQAKRFEEEIFLRDRQIDVLNNELIDLHDKVRQMSDGNVK